MPSIVFYSSGVYQESPTDYRSFFVARKLASTGTQVKFVHSQEKNSFTSCKKIQQNLTIFSAPFSTRIVSAFVNHSDIVHCIKPRFFNGTLSLLDRLSQSKKLVVEMDELEILWTTPKTRPLIQSIEKLLLTKVDLLIVCSTFLKKLYSNRGKYRILNVPYGVEMSLYDDCRRFSNLELVKESNDFLIVYSGALIPEYPLNYLIKGMQLILNKIPNSHLVIIGDGPEKESLKSMVRTLKLESKIIFTGFIPRKEMVVLQSKAHLLIFPIENNLRNIARCPQKTAEYMATGVPILTNKVGEVYQMLGSFGTYFEHNNAFSLAEEAYKIYRNYDTFKEKANKGLERARKKYSLEKISQKIIKEYYRIAM